MTTITSFPLLAAVVLLVGAVVGHVPAVGAHGLPTPIAQMLHPGTPDINPFTSSIPFEASVPSPSLSRAQKATMQKLSVEFNALHEQILQGVCFTTWEGYVNNMLEARAAEITDDEIYQYTAHRHMWGFNTARNLVTEVSLAVVGTRDSPMPWFNCSGARKILRSEDERVGARVKSFVCKCGVLLSRCSVACMRPVWAYAGMMVSVFRVPG